jgi:hypothetical protein
VPHPSAANAYPDYPGFYPSAPDGGLTDVPTGSGTGSPQHVFAQPDTASGSLTGTPPTEVGYVVGVVDTTTAARTGAPVEIGAGFGVTVADAPLVPTVPSGGTLPGPDLLPKYTQGAVSGSVTGRPVDVWAVDVATDRPTGSRSGTVVETSFGRAVQVADTPTGGGGASPAERLVADLYLRDAGAAGSRSGTTREVLDRGFADVPGAARTGGDLAAALTVGWIQFDTVTGSVTGLPVAGASVEWVDTVSALSWTGLGNEGPRPVWLIWPDVPGEHLSGLPLQTYEVDYHDRPWGDRFGSTTGEQFYPGFPTAPSDAVTIFTYNYPDGDLWPGFYPGLSVPFGRLVPARIDPFAAPPLDLRYRLYLCDTITGKLHYELPYQSLTWASKLNNVGSLSASVVVSHVYDAFSDADERDPRNLFRQFLATGSFRYCLVLTYGNAVVWAGPYTPSSVPGDTPQITIGGSDFGALLQRRLLVGANPPAVESDVALGPTTKSNLALTLVNYATRSGGQWALPWMCADPPPDAGNELRTYFGYDLWTVWDALVTLSMEQDGPDFRFDPGLVQRADGNYLQWNMVIGRPVLATPHEWGWDAPATAAVAWETNVSNFATTYYGTGSGQDRAKLVAVSTSDKLTRLGYPVLQMTDTLHGSTIDQNELQALTDGDLATYTDPVTRWTITVQASQPPLLGGYRVGETVLVRVEAHPVIPDGVYHRRITSLSGTAGDMVTITSSDSLVVQSTTSTGVQVITSD